MTDLDPKWNNEVVIKAVKVMKAKKAMKTKKAINDKFEKVLKKHLNMVKTWPNKAIKAKRPSLKKCSKSIKT